MKTFCGSLYFAAPELLSAEPYCGPEIDVWSFGVVLYVLVCGKVPFDDQSMPALHAKIKRGFVEYPSWLSSDCKDLIARMLTVDHTQRATLQEVRYHPWMMKGYDKPPDSYLPERKPLSLPLDEAVIADMSGFDFGDPDAIRKELQSIIESPAYVNACREWYKIHNGDSEEQHSLTPESTTGSYNQNRRSKHFSIDFYKRRSSISEDGNSLSTTISNNGSASTNNSSKIVDPTNAYHPLISIYYLVKERQERLRNSGMDKPKVTLPTNVPPQQDQTSKQQQQYAPVQQQTPVQISSQNTASRHQPSRSVSVKSTSRGHSYTKSVPVAAFNQDTSTVSDDRRFLAPTIPAPEAVHTSTNYRQGAQIPVPMQPTSNAPEIIPSRSRNRSKTQNAIDNPESLHTLGSGNTGSSGSSAGGDQYESNKSATGLATSLLRRFSSKRKNNREVSSPTTMTTMAYQQQQKSRHHHSQSASPAVGDINLDEPLYQATNSNYRQGPNSPLSAPPQTSNANGSLSRSTSTKQSAKQNSGENSNPSNSNATVTKSTSAPRKFHPSARAKSLGHVRHEMLTRQHLKDENQSGTATPGSADIADEFFDEYFGEPESKTSNTNSIRRNSSKNAINPTKYLNTSGGTDKLQSQSKSAQTSPITESMPSIEYPKQVFLKGFFSVQSTSTKPLAYIRSDIIRVLTQLGVEFDEIRGGFNCIHKPSIQYHQYTAPNSPVTNTSSGSPPQSPPSENLQQPQRGHWRKLSFGSGLFSNRRSKYQNESSGNFFDFSSDISTDSVGASPPGGASAAALANLGMSSSSGGAGQTSASGSTAGMNGGYAGGSDMLSSNIPGGAPTAHMSGLRTPLQFEIWIVRVPLLSLHGVQFKKLRGNSWEYKNLATKILSELRL